MTEKELEDIVCAYPELIEDGLTFLGRQLHVKGKYVDALFLDKYGQKLIVELKKGTILRVHIGQLLDYEGHFVSQDDPNIRVMLIGTRVPPNLRRSLDHHGFEWLELTNQFLADFLRKRADYTRLKYLETDFVEHVNVSFTKQPQKANRSEHEGDNVVSHTYQRIMNKHGFDETKYALDSRLKLMISDIQSLFFSFHDLLLTAIGPDLPPARTHIRGVTYFCNGKKAFIYVDFRRQSIYMNFYTGGGTIRGLHTTMWARAGDKKGGRFTLASSADIPLAVDYAKKAYYIAINESGI